MFERITPTNKAIILANVGMFVLQLVSGNMLVQFALWAPGSGMFQPWQVLTHGFLHTNYLHILFNMFAVFMFGSQVEQLFGARRYLIYYFVCMIGAALMYLIVVSAANLAASAAMGASGAIFGLLLAFGMGYPRSQIMIFPIPVPIRAWVAVILYAVAELYLGMTQIGGPATFAHLGGMVTGFVLIRYWQAQRRRPRR
jgi:membrane associated rhomboid family serine protease